MAWRKTTVEDQRKEFITLYQEEKVSVTELCRAFEISRKTAYKWIDRFEDGGFEGLKDRSRARHSQPQKTNDQMIEEIIEVKQAYQSWGPKKLLVELKKIKPSVEWPSATTMGKILERRGLTIPRANRKRSPAKTNPLSHCLEPNDIWSIDFKGWFITKDRVKCDPLTLTDAHSRFLLYCSKLYTNDAENVWTVLAELFSKYGLPRYLRHDNGPPFASRGAGRLSRLSVNVIKAGVIPEWIAPGKPYQNGRHERMHLTLKKEGIYPSKLTLEEQQLGFKKFLHYYNYERPHEGIGQKTPSSVYQKSEREWNGTLRSPEYGMEYKTSRVRDKGIFAWKGGDVVVGRALAGEYVGIKENEEGDFAVHYGPIFLGVIGEDKKLEYSILKSRTERKHKERVY